MTTLPEELKRDHVLIIRTIKALKKCNIDTTAGREALLSVQKTLSNHLEKEDKSVIPLSDGQLKRTEN